MPYLQVKVPVGTLNAHTVQERYEEFMQWFDETFPGLILGPVGSPGDPIEVAPHLEERFYWLHLREHEGSIEGFSYHQYAPEEGEPT